MLSDQQLLGMSRAEVHCVLKYYFNQFTISTEILGKMIQYGGDGQAGSHRFQNAVATGNLG